MGQDIPGTINLGEWKRFDMPSTGANGEQAVESDPNGITAKQPGAKLDAGKIDVTRGCFHYFPRALRAIASLSQKGAKKYSWKGWEKVPDGIHRYGAALGRHELRIEDDFTKRDPDTDEFEATAVAWNACARLELILRKLEQGEDPNQ